MRSIALVMVLATAASADTLYELRTDNKPAVTCPTEAPCVVEYDFTYLVTANRWKRYYLADYGTPDAPLRKGTTTAAERDARALQAITEILGIEKVKAATISCEVAARVPALAGLGATLDVPLPPSTAKPLPKIPAKDVHARWTKAYRAIDESYTPRDTFPPGALANMTGATFAKPRLVHKYAYASRQSCKPKQGCTEEITTSASLYVLWSPESADAYVVDTSLTAPEKQFTAKEKPVEAGAIAAISATLASLGHTWVALETASMCTSAPLLPNQGWFAWKN